MFGNKKNHSFGIAFIVLLGLSFAFSIDVYEEEQYEEVVLPESSQESSVELGIDSYEEEVLPESPQEPAEKSSRARRAAGTSLESIIASYLPPNLKNEDGQVKSLDEVIKDLNDDNSVLSKSLSPQVRKYLQDAVKLVRNWTDKVKNPK